MQGLLFQLVIIFWVLFAFVFKGDPRSWPKNKMPWAVLGLAVVYVVMGVIVEWRESGGRGPDTPTIEGVVYTVLSLFMLVLSGASFLYAPVFLYKRTLAMVRPGYKRLCVCSIIYGTLAALSYSLLFWPV